jgi:hypothetical protein
MPEKRNAAPPLVVTVGASSPTKRSETVDSNTRLAITGIVNVFQSWSCPEGSKVKMVPATGVPNTTGRALAATSSSPSTSEKLRVVS